MEPIGHEALWDEAATERIEREQQRELENHGLGPMETKATADAIGRRHRRWGFDAIAEAPCPERDERPDDRIADDDRPVGVGGSGPAGQQCLAGEARGERAGRRRHIPREVVPGERRGPPSVRDDLGEGSLLDRKERPDLVARRGDHADGAGQDEQRQPAREREHDARAQHQDGPRHEDTSPAQTIRVGRQPQRDERVAHERQGQDRADRQRVQAHRIEVQDEDDREEAVGEHPQRPKGKQRPTVPIQAAQAGDQAGIWGGGVHVRESRGWATGAAVCQNAVDER